MARARWKSVGAVAVIIAADYALVLTDCVLAGRIIGETALGALNLLMPVLSLASFCLWFVTSSYLAEYARWLRRGQMDKAAHTMGRGLFASLVTVALVVFATRILEPFYLAFMGPDEATLAFSLPYWNWFPLMLVFEALSMMGLCFVHAQGGALTCLASYFAQVIVNIVVSRGLAERMGMGGIALGTAFAYAMGFVLLLPRLRHASNRPCFAWSDCTLFRLLRPLRVRASSIGSFVWLVHAVLFLIITKYVIAVWGGESLPVTAVVFCVIRLTVFFAGIGLALYPFEKPFRDRREAVTLARFYAIAAGVSFSVLAVVVALFFLAPELVVGLFGIEDPELVEGTMLAERITVGSIVLCLVFAAPLLFLQVRKSTFAEAPLNYLQQYVLYRQSTLPDANMFNLAKLFRLRRGIDLEKLSQSLVASAVSHGAILSVVRRASNGEMVQRQELAPTQIKCPIIKMSEAELLARKGTLVRSFGLYGTCLLDAAIFDCGERAYLLSNFHHLICDGYSFPLILEGAHKVWQGETLEPDRYYDVLKKRAERAESTLAVAARTVLSEELRACEYPTLPQPDFKGHSGYGTVEQPLALPAHFERFLNEHRVTRHHVFLAATVLALAKITGQKGALVDWVFHGRVSKEEMRTVGAFMVDLPLVLENIDNLTAVDVLASVKQSTFRGIKNVSIIRTVEDCNPTGKDRLTFNYQNEWGELMSSGPVCPDGPYAWMIEETYPLAAPAETPENPFNVEIMEHHDGTRLFLEYDTGRYAISTVHRYAGLFKQSLEWLLS